jgi:hypothetical protein
MDNVTGVTDERIRDRVEYLELRGIDRSSVQDEELTALTELLSLRTALRDAKPAQYDPVHLGMLCTARDAATSPIHAASIDRAIAFIERVGRIEG